MNRHPTFVVAGVLFALASVAASPVYAEKNRYQAQVLVSDGIVPTAPHTDSHLVNGWGIAFNPAGFVWVADNGTGLSTLYDGFGSPQPLVVAIPAASGSTEHAKSTGIVFNGSGDFAVTADGKTGPAASSSPPRTA